MEERIINHTGSPITDDPPDVTFANLYPAVTECFVIILCG